MNKLVLSFTLATFIFVPVIAYADEWYEGGSLHGSTMNEWMSAEQSNKIATSADWLTTVLSQNQIAKAYSKLQGMAADIVNCVDTLVPITVESGYDGSKEKATALGILCIHNFQQNEWSGYL